MFATPSPSDRAATVAAMQRNRAVARLALSAKRDGARTAIDNLREGGGYRIKFPAADGALDAVLVNTGGGLLGGDRLSLDIHAGAGANMRVTTQSAEKIYRAFADPAVIDATLRVESGARLHWTPQEAILFSGARLTRRIEVDMTADAELVVAEAAVFGRLEMGERLGEGLLADSWRVRRDGRLIHAEETRLDGDLSTLLDRRALGGGARAAATLLLFAPDAESRLDAARALFARDGVSAGASAWDGRLVIRLLSPDPARLRRTFSSLAAFLTGRDTPRFW